MFRNIWEFVVSKPWTIISCAIIIAVAALTALPGIVIDSSHLGLISKNNPEVKKFLEFKEEFGAQNDLIAVIHGGDEGERRLCADRLAQKLAEEKELVSYVFYKVDEEVIPGALLYGMSDDDLHGLEGWLSSLSSAGARIDSSSPFWPVETFNRDLAARMEQEEEVPEYIDRPLDFLEEYLLAAETNTAPENSVSRAPSPAALAYRRISGSAAFDDEGYLSSRDGKYKLIAVLPTGDVDDPAFTTRLNSRVREISDGILKDFPGLAVGLTGLSAVTAEETTAIKRDMRMSGLLGMVAVTFLMLIFPLLRKFSVPVLLTLAFSVLCTLVFSRVTPGHLNLISSSCIVIILGLGVDYGIHFSTAFAEELEKSNYRQAIVSAFIATSPGVAAGALTTACVFFLFSFADFKGFVELGTVAGAGILICFASYLLLFPAMLAVSEKKLSGAAKMTPVDIPAAIISFSIRNYVAVIAAFIIMGIAACALAPRLRFVPAFHSLLPSGSEALKLLNDLQENSETNWEYTGVGADSLEKLCEKEKVLKSLSVVKNVESPCSFAAGDPARNEKIDGIKSLIKDVMTPATGATAAAESSVIPAATQDDALESLETLSDNLHELSVSLYLDGSPDVSERVNGLRDIVKRIMEASGAGADLAGALRGASERMEKNLLEMSNATRDSLLMNPDIRRRYVGKDGKYMMYVYAAKPMWDGNFWKEYSTEIRAAAPEATGLSFVANEMIYASMRSFRKILSWAPLLFGILLFAKFRNLGLVALSIIPLLTGLLLLAGLLVACGIDLNPINLMAFSIIYGFGVDDGIMITHRYGRFRGAVDVNSFSRIGLPVFLTSLTTMACFAALGTSTHQGLRTFGITAAFGAMTTLATSLLLLPAIMKAIEKKK